MASAVLYERMPSAATLAGRATPETVEDSSAQFGRDTRAVVADADRPDPAALELDLELPAPARKWVSTGLVRGAVVRDAETGTEREIHAKVVINATGVIIHTNLGRAPLSDDTLAAMKIAAQRLLSLHDR